MADDEQTQDEPRSPVDLAVEAHKRREEELDQRRSSAQEARTGEVGRMIVASGLTGWFPGTEWELVTHDPFLIIQPEGGGFMLHLRRLGQTAPPEVRFVTAPVVDGDVQYTMGGLVTGPADVGAYLTRDAG